MCFSAHIVLILIAFSPFRTCKSLTMHHLAITGFVAIGFLSLFATTMHANVTCPLQCQCSKYDVKCIHKDLRTIPKGLPLTARRIDLSNNPHLHIPCDYFLQYNHLYILSLKNCGQKGPVYLPNTIKDVKLDDNFFTVNALKEMFSTNSSSLKKITLANNVLSASDTKTVLKVLPPGLKLLLLSNNIVKTLNREDMLRLKEISTFYIDNCSLESIESNTFDDMRKLFKLRLSGNKIRFLPDKLFTFNLRLSELQINDNKLEEFNATKIGLTKMITLCLQRNSILTFDPGELQPFTTLLNNNNIRRLETRIFHKNPSIFELNLSNNNIHYISENAFRGVKNASQIQLSNNNLQSLPNGLFKGMKISHIFLQNNQFSNLSGVLDDINNFPVTLFLTGNKGFKSLNGSEFRSLPSKSIVYINCGKLKQVTNIWEIKAKILCAPSVKETIHTLFNDGFSCNGYQCRFMHQPPRYECSPCRLGYINVCVTSSNGECVKCPPGSYYQDEIASTKCKICRPGQFVPPERSPGTSASDCQTCPEGTNTETEAGTRACKCLYGYYRRYRFGPCRKCTDKGFNCSLDYQVLRNGFWMTWEGTRLEHTTNEIFHNVTQGTCERAYKAYIRNLDITDDTYDRKTTHYNCQMPLTIKCPMKTSCIGGIQPRCSSGYTGALCAVCKRGYTRQFNKCVQCPKRAWVVMKFIGHIALFVIFCVVMSLTDKINCEYTESCVQRGQPTDHRTVADIMLSSFKILIGFYQVLSSILHALSNVHWPENVLAAINILQYIQFQIISLPSVRCLNSEWNINAIDEFWIILITIITIPFLAVVYYLVMLVYIQYQCSLESEAKRKRNIWGRNCIKFVAIILFVTYTLTSTNIMEVLPLNCHSFCTAKQDNVCTHALSFLRSDYSIPCPTLARNKATLIASYACLAIPLGLPLLLFLLLNRYAPRQRKRVHFQNNDILEEQNEDDGECCNDNEIHFSSINSDSLFGDSYLLKMTSAFRFTYENYHSRYWYWEVIEMIRKLLMTVGVVLFVARTKIGLTCTVIVAMFFTILHAVVKPFKSQFEGGVQFLSLILVPLSLAFGAVVQSQERHRPKIITKETDSFLLGFYFVTINSLPLVLILARILVVIACRVISRLKETRCR